MSDDTLNELRSALDRVTDYLNDSRIHRERETASLQMVNVAIGDTRTALENLPGSGSLAEPAVAHLRAIAALIRQAETLGVPGLNGDAGAVPPDESEDESESKVAFTVGPDNYWCHPVPQIVQDEEYADEELAAASGGRIGTGDHVCSECQPSMYDSDGDWVGPRWTGDHWVMLDPDEVLA